MNRLNNEYHALLSQAATVSITNGVPTRMEAKLYQRAAEICAQGAANSIKELQTQWLERQRECERNIRRIVQAINPSLLQPQEQAFAYSMQEKKVSASESQLPKSSLQKVTVQKGSKSSKKASGSEVISQDTVNTWFKSAPKQSFEQVAGMETLKQQMERIVEDIGNSELNAQLEMENVQSFFFYGLPGCGKTFIVEAFAHELVQKYGYNYMKLSGSDIHESLVGVSEKIIHRMFEEARKNAPCILFVDEIDSVCVNRSMPNLPAHVTSATNAFLTGFNELSECEEQVIFIGATNHPKNVDPAMLDRVEMVAVTLPDSSARANYFCMQLDHVISLENEFTYEEMGKRCEQFNYRDLKKMTSRLKKELKTCVGKAYGDDHSAVEAIRNGEFCFTREIFEHIRKSYPLRRKDETEMLEWAAKTESELG